MDFNAAAEALVKEAGLGRDMLAWVKKRYRKAAQVGRKLDSAQRTAGLHVYSRLPSVAQKALVDPKIMDPSDQTAGLAISAAKNMLKLGSVKKRKK